MPEQPQWGTVDLGVDVLQGHGEQSQPGYDQYVGQHRNTLGKQQYNPGRNQELNLPPDLFRMEKDTDWNPYGVESRMNTKGVHERIKELLGEGINRREAVIRAKQEAQKASRGDVGTITPKDVYRSKYQAREPFKRISPLTSQVQEYPFM